MPAENRWQAYVQAAAAAEERVPQEAGFQASACRVFAASEFVAGLCARFPQLLADLLDSNCG